MGRSSKGFAPGLTHMQATTVSQFGFESRPSRLRIAGLALSYAVLLLGVLSLFTVPLYVAAISFAGGVILFRVVSLREPTMTWSSWITVVAGMIVIFGVLYLVGEERVRQWRPHPAGYIPAWLVCFHAFRHIRHVISGRESATPKTA